MSEVKYPEIEVQLTGEDGNAFFILGRVQSALKKSGVSKDEVAEFVDEATAGDYNELLGTVMRWVNVS